MQYYRAAKAEIRELEQKQQKAEHSKQRFELRRASAPCRGTEGSRAQGPRRARARAKAAQGESAQVVSGTTAATPSAAPKSGLSETQKKLKIEASMAQVALKKAESSSPHTTRPNCKPGRRSAQSRRSGAAGTRCRHAGECQRSTYRQPSGRRGAEEAKIEAAMLKAQIRKLEKFEAPDDDQQAELARLRQQLHEAEQTLSAAQSAAPAPAAKPANDEALKRPRSKPPCSRRRSASWKSSKHRTRTSRPSSLVCVSSCTKPNRPWRPRRAPRPLPPPSQRTTRR